MDPLASLAQSLLPVVAVLAGLLGLAIGSFLNVVAARVPAGRSVVNPPSACPKCDNPSRPRDNVPVLGWLLLRGKCRDCAEPISVRYPIVEAATGVLFAVTALTIGVTSALPAFLLLAALTVVLTVIDLDTLRLPDAIVLPAYPAAAVLLSITSLTDGFAPLGRALLGGLVLWGAYFALWFGTGGRGMGYGDVKLAGLLGAYLAFLGWGPLVIGAFGAFVVGGLVGLGLMVSGRVSRGTRIPFGPYMFAGAWIGILAGDAIWHGYLALVGLA
jgi:leader peptidase (prepilin peptidase)/N-methyltransferase